MVCKRSIQNDECVSYTWTELRAHDITSFSSMGKPHGSLTQAGKVRAETPKVERMVKPPAASGRVTMRKNYNKRFLSVNPDGLRKMKMNAHSDYTNTIFIFRPSCPFRLPTYWFHQHWHTPIIRNAQTPNSSSSPSKYSASSFGVLIGTQANSKSGLHPYREVVDSYTLPNTAFILKIHRKSGLPWSPVENASSFSITLVHTLRSRSACSSFQIWWVNIGESIW
jgi:small subunit ribosomal protein S30e